MSTKIALLWEDSNRTATKLTDETTVISEEEKTPSTNVSSICHKVYTLFLQFSFRSTKGDTPQQTTMTTKPTTTTTTTMMMIMICEQPWPHKCSYTIVRTASAVLLSCFVNDAKQPEKKTYSATLPHDRRTDSRLLTDLN